MRASWLALWFILLGGPAVAEDRLVLQLNWVPQAEFAGFYMAEAKGFYKDAGLAVTILPGGPEIDPIAPLASGQADVIVDWMPAAAVARERRGLALVNIAQLFSRCSLVLVCRSDADVNRPQDLQGKTIGVFEAGNQYPLLAWLNALALDYAEGAGAGGAHGVSLVPLGADYTGQMRRHVFDCMMATTYNELQTVKHVGLGDFVSVLSFAAWHACSLENGIYVLDEDLEDPAQVDRLQRFVTASKRGWKAARKDPEGAVGAVMAGGAEAGSTAHQTVMLPLVLELMTDPSWAVDPSSYSTTVGRMLLGGDKALLKAPPPLSFVSPVAIVPDR